MASILSNSNFHLYSTIDTANQDLQKQSFGLATSAAIEDIFSAQTLTPTVKEHIDALKNRAEWNEHSSIELLQNIALRNDAIGQHAEKCLYEVYSGKGEDNGAAITIEQTAQHLIENRDSRDTQKTDINTLKLESSSAIMVMASGGLGKEISPVLRQQIDNSSPNPDEKDLACQQLNHALRTCFSTDQLPDDIITQQTQEAKTPGEPIEALLVQHALKGACINSERCADADMFDANNLQQLKEQVQNLQAGAELAIPIMLDANHFGLVMVKKSSGGDDNYEMSVFDPQFDQNSPKKQNYDKIMDDLGVSGTRTYLMGVAQDANDCGAHCAMFLEHYSQGSVDIQASFDNYKAIVNVLQQNDISAMQQMPDRENAEIETSSLQFRNSFMTLCTKGLMDSYTNQQPAPPRQDEIPSPKGVSKILWV